MCPFCQSSPSSVKKKGFYAKSTTRTTYVQRYFCRVCRRSFSDQTGRLSYREKKPHVDQKIYRLLCSGVSQARIASVLNIRRSTVAAKIIKLAQFARRDHREWVSAQKECAEIQFDELETLEHSKCKPVSVAIAVNARTREVVGAYACSMPAKGLMAAPALRRYGKRADNRAFIMTQLMESIKTAYGSVPLLKSDEKASYKPLVKRYFPHSKHETCKGQRGCVVGQGELKATAFDPLFKLNHTCAMFRDNLKTLARRTWCTVKKLCRLQDLLDLYVHFHNRFVVQKIRIPNVSPDPVTWTSFVIAW